MRTVHKFMTLAAFVLILNLCSGEAWSQDSCTVTFENLTPPQITDPRTSQVRYPRCGDTISGTLVLTNPTNHEFSYSNVNVDLGPIGVSEVVAPYNQYFPKPYRTIGPGEAHQFPFSLQTKKKFAGDVQLLGAVSFAAFSFDNQSIDNAYQRSALQKYHFECGAAKSGGFINAWNKLSGKAKALWLAFAAFLAWRLWRQIQIWKLGSAAEQLMKTGKAVSSTGLVGGNGVTPNIVQLPKGQLCFQVPLDVCTDGTGPAADGEGLVSDGSGTSDNKTAMGYIDADKNNYIVLTGNNWYKKFGIEKGDVALVMYQGKITGAVFAEVGPTNKLGEASVSTLESVGALTRNPNGLVANNATPHPATVIVIPGSGDQLPRGRPGYVSQGTPIEKTNFPTNAEINSVAFAHARNLGLMPAEVK